jgi:hypothetical protein
MIMARLVVGTQSAKGRKILLYWGVISLNAALAAADERKTCAS